MEADDLSVLHKSLFEDKLSATDLFLQKLRSDPSIKSALQRFYSILKRGVSLIDDDANNSERKLGFQLWTDSQIKSVVSLGIAIVSSSRSLSVEQAEPTVVAVVHQLVEFAVCYLEKAEFSGNDFSIQPLVGGSGSWNLTSSVRFLLLEEVILLLLYGLVF
uniref:Uncharacterized protein n=1 Tax=Salix viminalis TaxID=40686 RepID=A0A6N2L1D7_SALVM